MTAAGLNATKFPEPIPLQAVLEVAAPTPSQLLATS